MPTYKELQDWIKDRFGFVPKTCWIAHAKEICSLPVRIAPNRVDSTVRKEPCPAEKLPAILAAFRQFNLI
jgi:hypothetical protein